LLSASVNSSRVVTRLFAGGTLVILPQADIFAARGVQTRV